MLVSSMGDHAHVYSTDVSAKLSLDGQPPVDFSADGVDLPSLSAGAQELNVAHAGENYKLQIEVAANPSLTAFVESGQNVGTLVVVTGQDKSRVFLNGKQLPQLTQGGQLRIANLEPKEYTVRVAKDGFQDVPEQKDPHPQRRSGKSWSSDCFPLSTWRRSPFKVVLPELRFSSIS